MQEVILLKYGELILKGLNRPQFEHKLLKRIRSTLRGCGTFTVTQAQSTVYVEPQDADASIDDAIRRLQKVFGIVSLVRACVVEKDMAAIEAAVVPYLRDEIEQAKTFRVNARRADKRFPLPSPEIAKRVAERVGDAFPDLQADMRAPELTITVEIRDTAAYIHADSLPGAGGMPSGSCGRAAVLISGGIDSPVAAYMMARRGMSVCAVHFASPPYTSPRAKAKVLDLLKIVSAYSGPIACFVVPFTALQEQIRAHCKEEFFTILLRRFMMRAAARIAEGQDCAALITGESIGQVASQTIEAITCTQAASTLPVLRPLIGMDKEEIIRVARRIDTFETSILPYADCCTVFTPRHPRTKPRMWDVEQEEAKFDFAPLLDAAVEAAEKIVVCPE
ncbi:tRNA uracil 4-sulfurtransferase ThiI [Ethanoligenens harbinense]|uniref:Probable tRNA sulfurtransferase n=1 Tax=Ethanoligenens harbinense (strain DSM 18485 / JCM 12961 / CGMCC 1.5033 / YUAN-3) TaxID=663278 RepID=E6U8U3_ETHHY|nr:tRNA uracil 4-sulfurtransferase ThiI [Ethanoligenens harbinense]ADU27178.1 thiamine biosynthesis/tRNA modification protein ThiI [Ethanoligenens harbinense YUAN-3]AVQ96247.1 tRNA 4-thiouridine(8) synthase ThiI [Ethanoligenens harbinense YUAN-3]AYF38907.1 tRNA 4-thiouridine(8) synthase ThiI [Ethanoligenens harbinense]AYF41657.1 tRNA 4-thiouridine(8) synthase ThiI [Ethanoligenens harbinense]QCN92488.1 tRNA 4-thiouridine(8) synthase ThiI [Ethanoligenens harbinense]